MRQTVTVRELIREADRRRAVSFLLSFLTDRRTSYNFRGQNGPIFQRLRRMSMTIVESHSIAMAHLQAGRLADAERIYREILRIDARNVEALLHLGIIASMAGNYQVAINLTNQACSLRPDNPAILMNLGRICGLAGQRQQAQAAYRRVTEIQPNQADALEYLGDLLLKDKKPAEAEPY
jgi:tetratricopeptide (TPR) repeat protein